MWNSSARASIRRHTALVTAMLFGWLSELNYWLYQNEADGMSSFWFDDMDVAWWGISLFTVYFQILYLFYLIKKLSFSTNWKIAGLSSLILMLLSQFMCMSNIYISVSVLMFYWLSKLLIGMIFIKLCMYWNQDMQRKSDTMADELFVMFIFVHFSFNFLSSPFFYLYHITLFVKDLCTFYIFKIIAVVLCTTIFIFLSILDNLISFIVTGGNTFYATTPNTNWFSNFLPNTIVLLFYFWADMSTCLNYLILSTVHISLSKVWDMTEMQCWKVLLSEDRHKPLAWIRVSFFAAIVTIIPILLTVNLAAYIQVNVWLLLIATGNAVPLWQALGTFVEVSIVVFAPNSTHILCCVILVKYFVSAVAYGMYGYCQLLLPFFQEVFFARILIFAWDATRVFKMFKIMFIVFFYHLYKRQLLNLVDTFPAATTKQLQEYDHTCEICHDYLNEGRVLKCSHIFHGACLEEFFLTRNSCPTCNEMVFFKSSSIFSMVNCFDERN